MGQTIIPRGSRIAGRTASRFFDPRQGDEAVRVRMLEHDGRPFEPARTNCFGIYWIESSAGRCFVDAAEWGYEAKSLIFFSPYQYIRFFPDAELRGVLVEFHANFLCVETFHAEVGCSSRLFNDPYDGPVLGLGRHENSQVKTLVARIVQEQRGKRFAYGEVVLAYLKVLLVLGTRFKSTESESGSQQADPRDPWIGELKELIEQHYPSQHAPADYAQLLHTTPKTLGRIVREQLGTTLTELIRNRILTHAKWQLLHTLKPVKQVARELGFDDELFFSRLFKKATGVSPTFFREFETAIRDGSNLSMTLGKSSILNEEDAAENGISDPPISGHR